MTHPCPRRQALLPVFVCAVFTTQAVLAQPKSHKAALPAASESVLRIAHSNNGKHFEDVALFAKGATAPTLVRLKNDKLLALWEQAIGENIQAVAYSISTNEGKTWSRMKLLDLNTNTGLAVPARRPSAILLPDGLCRIYFNAPLSKQGTGQNDSQSSAVLCAVTRNGTKFQIDPKVRQIIDGGSAYHLAVTAVDRTVHLIADTLDRGENYGEALHYTSRNGREFLPSQCIKTTDARFVGSIVSVDAGCRAYVTSKTATSFEIRSLVSRNGSRWQSERGVRLGGGFDPAVVRQRDGSFLMIYGLPRDAPNALRPSRSGGQKHGLTSSRNGKASTTPPGRAATKSGFALAGQLDEVDDLTIARYESQATLDLDQWDAQLATAEGSDEDARLAQELSDFDWDENVSTDDNTSPTQAHSLPEVRPSGLVQRPDFQNKLDYVSWWHQEFVFDGPENAYRAYSEFLNTPDDVRTGVEMKINIPNLFDSTERLDRPYAWDANEHPEWSLALEENADLLARYREAARMPYYAYPLREELDQMMVDMGDNATLMGLILPNLSQFRHLAKATLSDAWRIDEGGRVSPDRMIDAWETVLGNARQLKGSATLIEELVGAAEERLTYDTARWALASDVFQTEEELQAAFDSLVENDPGMADPIKSVRAEHAMCLDILQWAFWPENAGGEPSVRLERMKDVFGYSDEILEEMKTVTKDDIIASFDSIDGFYTDLAGAMTLGYPDARMADVNDIAERHITNDPISRNLLPAMGRIQQIRARNLADNRATKLAYATKLYKKKHGYYPPNLDAIAAEYGSDIVTDPFTGGYFGYEVSENGAKIYSLSENGLDDNGVHSPRWDRGAGETESDDYVFWPPQAN